MELGIAVIAASWILNAMMDAIDHGSGAPKLGLLWHALKWLSYALPFGYILIICLHMSIQNILLLACVLWAIWEALYRFLRHIEFHKFDQRG